MMSETEKDEAATADIRSAAIAGATAQHPHIPEAETAARFDRRLASEIAAAEARGWSKGYGACNREWQTSGDGEGLV